MILLMLFAFIAGIVTILSPCILPILPIVLSGSITGGKRRPFGIVFGFILSFTFFTLALSTIVKATGISANSLRLFAVFVIFSFGISLLIPKIQIVLEQIFSTLTSKIPQTQSESTGFFGGIPIGLSLGLIWAPCVGPILASVITLAATGTVNSTAIFVTLSYSVGTGIPMLAITYSGRSLFQQIPWLLEKTGIIQKVFGIVMICTALAIFFNIDRAFQTYILTVFPNYGISLTIFEKHPLIQKNVQFFTK
ncbi:cytochrome c biogenesis CcdA family protein [Patescibacteria group bacterium]